MSRSSARLVAETWEWTLRTSPDHSGEWLAEMFGVRRRRSYRERLDEQPVNFYGELIPRIETVRRNLVMLGRPKERPTIPN